MWQRPLPVLEASGSRLQLGWGKEGSAWWPELRSAFTCSLTSSQKGEKLAWSLQDFTGTVSPPWSASFQANLMEIPLIFVVASQYSYTQKVFFFNHPKLRPLKRCDIIFFFLPHFWVFGNNEFHGPIPSHTYNSKIGLVSRNACAVSWTFSLPSLSPLWVQKRLITFFSSCFLPFPVPPIPTLFFS